MKYITTTFGKIPAFALASLLALRSLCGAEPMPWENPKYETNLRETLAESRPGPDEKGWTEWLKHHENRKRWCTEKDRTH
jgi:hypothetical protein